MTTFITVGNATQPFDRLLEAAALITEILPKPVVVQRGVSRVGHPAWDSRDFVTMQVFDELVRRADLLIMHCGAGSVIHAVRARRRPIVIPRRARCGEIVDDHQVEFAEALDKAGYILLAREAADIPGLVGKALNGDSAHASLGNAALVERIAGLLRESLAAKETR